MFTDLPDYLKTLNTISTTPPSGTYDTENEDAIWNYLNTDDLFNSFGTQASMFQPKEEEEEVKPSKVAPADLKSFIEQFADKFALPLPLPFNAAASSSSTEMTPTSAGVNTRDIMPSISSTSLAESPSEDGRSLGAKKARQSGVVTIEVEDE